MLSYCCTHLSLLNLFFPYFYQSLVFLGSQEDLEQELLCSTSSSSNNSSVGGGNHKFIIPILALPDGDGGSDGTKICVIPPTPLPPDYDPYDDYYTQSLTTILEISSLQKSRCDILFLYQYTAILLIIIKRQGKVLNLSHVSAMLRTETGVTTSTLNLS